MTAPVRTIGSRLEPLLDDWLIDRFAGAQLRLHHPIRREVALRFDRPWEGQYSYDQVVMADAGRFRLWYRGWHESTDGLSGAELYARIYTCYAESDDGVAWHRPELGLVEHDGSSANNIVLTGSDARAVSVFRDDNPAVDPAERYKAIGVGPRRTPGLTALRPVDLPAWGQPLPAELGDGDLTSLLDRLPWPHRAELRGFVSPDGLHWRALEPDPLIVAPPDPMAMFDSHNLAFWDSELGEYVVYARGWTPPGVRAIRRCTSPDFRRWSEFAFIDMGDAPTEHLYKNGAIPYFRAPHIRLMFPKRFVSSRRRFAEWEGNGISDTVFMSSRDGVRWQRRFHEAFLRPGSDPENWTDRNMYLGSGMLPTAPHELSFYAIEHYRHPGAHLRRYTLRTDGFVSAYAGAAGGELLTHPLVFDGAQLQLNLATSAAGGVQVELQQPDGTPLPGYRLEDCPPLFGDDIARTVRWHGGARLDGLAGRPLRLRLVLHDADVYALQFV